MEGQGWGRSETLGSTFDRWGWDWGEASRHLGPPVEAGTGTRSEGLPMFLPPGASPPGPGPGPADIEENRLARWLCRSSPPDLGEPRVSPNSSSAEWGARLPGRSSEVLAPVASLPPFFRDPQR